MDSICLRDGSRPQCPPDKCNCHWNLRLQGSAADVIARTKATEPLLRSRACLASDECSTLEECRTAGRCLEEPPLAPDSEEPPASWQDALEELGPVADCFYPDCGCPHAIQGECARATDVQAQRRKSWEEYEKAHAAPFPSFLRKCQAIQFSDSMVCASCALVWDTNDFDPPACNQGKRVGSRKSGRNALVGMIVGVLLPAALVGGFVTVSYFMQPAPMPKAAKEAFAPSFRIDKTEERYNNPNILPPLPASETVSIEEKKLPPPPFTCAVVGDSIANGLADFFAHCDANVKDSIGSAAIIPRVPAGKSVVLISAGSNDANNPALQKNLRAIRAKATGRVVWVVPVHPKPRAAVLSIAKENGDKFYTFTPANKNSIQPRNYEALARVLKADMEGEEGQ